MPRIKGTVKKQTTKASVGKKDANNKQQGSSVSTRDTAKLQVKGQIIAEYGLPVGQMTLRLYHRDFGGAAVLLNDVGKTNSDGSYDLSYTVPTTHIGKAMNLEVRAVDASGKEVPLSEVKLAAAPQEVLNLVAPATLAPLQPEYTRLAGDVAAAIGTMAKLADAQEGGDRHDLSVLHQATGWDARLLAMASTAGTLATETKLSQEVVYGLLRVGFPSNPTLFASVGREAMEQGLKKAKDSGLVALTDQQIAEAKQAFTAYAKTVRLKEVLPGSVSSTGDLLAKSGLAEKEQRVFEDLYLAHHGTGAALWAQAKAKGISDKTISTLQLQGKLSYLTFNNAALVADLQKELASPKDLSPLVEKEFYKRETWVTRIKQLGGTTDLGLAALIPPSYTGNNLMERLHAYADDLASKVRLSFPKAVIGKMVEKGELPLGEQVSGVRGQVKTFLTNAKGFEFGQVPISTYVKANEERVFAGISKEDQPAVLQAVTSLQRVYQMTPSDEAMVTTLQLGFTSAHDVLSYSYDEYMDRFADRYRTTKEAELVYRKAQQISAVTHEFFAMAKQLQGATPLAALSPSTEVRNAAKDSLIKQFPTMESLFGSMDYCECEHCQSVLSPAAYFVDLLKFLDQDPKHWVEFEQGWEATHGGEKFLSKYRHPYDTLTARRPDLPHLPLTCENTHTVLPYIDLVNEILEYYVAHSELGEAAAYDTGSTTSAELLAEPQRMESAAYEKLEGARYPLTLPFDLPLETVRRFCAHLGTSLWKVMDVFRRTDALYKESGHTVPYDRAAIFIESLGLSPAEYAIFTDATPLATWHRLYGFSDNEKPQDVVVTLTSAKTLSRRLGVTYKELAELVKTRFANPSHDTLILYDPEPGCNFERTTLRYASSLATPAKDLPFVEDLVFLKLNYFARLWKKLGWSIEETDLALQAFLPKSTLPLSTTTLGPAFKTALLFIAHLKAIETNLALGSDGRRTLLTLWSDLPSTGQGAGGLSDRDVELILREQKPRPAEPTSILHRHSVLAKALHLSIPELMALKGLFGRDPFKPLHADPVTTLEQDHPYSETWAFIEMVQLIQAGPLSPEDLEYLIRHRALDPVGTYRSNPTESLVLIRDLSDGIQRIVSEHPLLSDPMTLTDTVLQQKLSLVLPSEVVDTFMGMWTGQQLYKATKEGVPESGMLNPAAFSGQPAVGVTYDHTRQWQHLTYRGVLTESRKHALKRLNPSPVFAALLDAVQHQATQFFTDHFVSSNPRLGTFRSDDFDVLFASNEGLTDTQRHDQVAQKRRRLAEALIPYVQQQLRLQMIMDRMASELGADPSLVGALLTDQRLLENPSQPGTPLLGAFDAVRLRGVTVTFFDATDTPLKTEVVETIDTTLFRFERATRARYEGYLMVPTTAPYRFVAAFDGEGRAVELRFDHIKEPLLNGTPALRERELSAYLDLTAGTVYGFTCDVRNLEGTGVRVQVLSERLPKGPLSRLPLYPKSSAESVHRVAVLLKKVILLIDKLDLTEREVRYLLTHKHDFAQLNFAHLPTRREDVTPDTSPALFTPLWRLLEYVRLKQEMVGGSDDLITVFQRSRWRSSASDTSLAKNGHLQELSDLIAQMTRRESTVVRSAIDQLGFSSIATPSDSGFSVEAVDFADERGLRRLWEVLRMVEQSGRDAGTMSRWTEVVDVTKSFAERSTVAQDFRTVMKGSYDTATWQTVARPIFDSLRQRRRDALVAYLLPLLRFDRVEQLFEYFLIDPGVEPIVQTSRLRLAISSVQLFIQRCLLNLEAEVHPSTIKSKQWQWMKRYRVWEANRKMFLFPENWLEPEFRDDKTHLFQELESALLQGDVSSELAEDALFRYLQQLEELARLQVVALYVEERPLDPDSKTVHIIGRTFNNPHKYYYRRYAHKMWTPWEPVQVDIEGDHMVIVMWRERLNLFWVTFMEKASSAAPTDVEFRDADSVGAIAKRLASAVAPKEVLVQLNWSELVNGQWTTRQSSGTKTQIQVGVLHDFNSQDVFIHASKEYEDGKEQAVTISLSGGGLQSDITAFRVVSKNSEPQIVKRDWSLPDLPYGTERTQATRHVSGDALRVSYEERVLTDATFLTSGPAVASGAIGRLDVFVRGQDDALWHKVFDQGRWSRSASLGGVLTSDPAAVSWGRGRRDVFVRGTDGALWHRWDDRRWWREVGEWPEWNRVGAQLSSGPTVCSWSPGRLDVFYRGTDNALWHMWYGESTWFGPEPLGGVLTSDPAAVSSGPGRIDVFVRGTDAALWHLSFAAGQWSGWQSRGEVLSSGPAVCSWGEDRLDVFYRGTDNALWHKWFDGKRWVAPEFLGGVLASDPTAVSWGLGRMDIFGCGLDGVLLHRWFADDVWSPGWSPIGDMVVSASKPFNAQPKTIIDPGDRFNLVTNNVGVAGHDLRQRELKSLVDPFFYEDERHTFFVEPTMVETPLTEWNEWVVSTPREDVTVPGIDSNLLDVKPQIPPKRIVPLPPDKLYGKYQFKRQFDWVTAPVSVYEFKEQMVGQGGRVRLIDTVTALGSRTSLETGSVELSPNRVGGGVTGINVLDASKINTGAISSTPFVVIGPQGVTNKISQVIGGSVFSKLNNVKR